MKKVIVLCSALVFEFLTCSDAFAAGNTVINSKNGEVKNHNGSKGLRNKLTKLGVGILGGAALLKAGQGMVGSMGTQASPTTDLNLKYDSDSYVPNSYDHYNVGAGTSSNLADDHGYGYQANVKYVGIPGANDPMVRQNYKKDPSVWDTADEGGNNIQDLSSDGSIPVNRGGWSAIREGASKQYSEIRKKFNRNPHSVDNSQSPIDPNNEEYFDTQQDIWNGQSSAPLKDRAEIQANRVVSGTKNLLNKGKNFTSEKFTKIQKTWENRISQADMGQSPFDRNNKGYFDAQQDNLNGQSSASLKDRAKIQANGVISGTKNLLNKGKNFTGRRVAELRKIFDPNYKTNPVDNRNYRYWKDKQKEQNILNGQSSAPLKDQIEISVKEDVSPQLNEYREID